jgi:outer membrane protein assembly factor BamB
MSVFEKMMQGTGNKRIFGAGEWGELIAFDPEGASHVWKSSHDFYLAAVAHGPNNSIIVAGAGEQLHVPMVAGVDRRSGQLRFQTAILGASLKHRLARADVFSLLIDGNRGWVAVQDGGTGRSICTVVSFDARSGEVLFSRRLDNQGPASSCIMVRDDTDLFIGQDGQKLTRLNACFGEIQSVKSFEKRDHFLSNARDGHQFILAELPLTSFSIFA